MPSVSHNRLRQLQGLVTIDSWYSSDEKRRSVADLHVYVHFKEARLGGQQADEIAFRMALRQAEIRVSQSEPASFYFDPQEIWRGDEDPTGRVTQKIAASARASFEGEGQLAASPVNVGASIKAKSAASQSNQGSVEVESKQTLKGISVSFSRHDANHPTWVLKPTGFNGTRVLDEPVLEGRPWPAKQQRLLQMTTRPSGLAKDPSAIFIKIACRREDIRFYDIHIRDREGEFRKVANEAPLRSTIEEYLKNCLAREGLPAGDMKSIFSIVILGEAIAEPRRRDDELG
jgi:hypothetical protein